MGHVLGYARVGTGDQDAAGQRAVVLETDAGDWSDAVGYVATDMHGR